MHIDYNISGLCYCDISFGPVSWEHYSMFLTLLRKKGKIAICGDTKNLVRRLMPRVKWTYKGEQFIMNIKYELLRVAQFDHPLMTRTITGICLHDYLFPVTNNMDTEDPYS